MNIYVLYIIFFYLNVDELYKIKDTFRLNVIYYCINVKTIKQTKWSDDYFTCDNKNEMDLESCKGYLEVVKYVHFIGKDCTTNAMDFASHNGHLEVVKYLHKIQKMYV